MPSPADGKTLLGQESQETGQFSDLIPPSNEFSQVGGFWIHLLIVGDEFGMGIAVQR